MKKTAFAGLALAALALSGCGGGSPSAAGSSAAPASSAPAGSSAPVESATAASPSTSAGTTTVADPCNVLDEGKIADLTGVTVSKGTSQALGGSTVCTWLPADPKAKGTAVFSAQEGPLPGDLSQVETQLAAQFDGKVSPLTVDGADDARYVTGTKSGLDIVDVLAQKNGTFFQVLVAAQSDAASHKDGAIKITEALLKG